MRYAINQNFCGNADDSFNNFIINFFLVLYKMLRSISKTVQKKDIKLSCFSTIETHKEIS